MCVCVGEGGGLGGGGGGRVCTYEFEMQADGMPPALTHRPSENVQRI